VPLDRLVDTVNEEVPAGRASERIKVDQLADSLLALDTESDIHHLGNHLPPVVAGYF
jgi:hypothetical protein